MGKYLVGIDGGTTGCKTVVFDLDGNIIGSDYREYPCYYPKPGWVEQTAEDITPALFDSCKAAITASGLTRRKYWQLVFQARALLLVCWMKTENASDPLWAGRIFAAAKKKSSG